MNNFYKYIIKKIIINTYKYIIYKILNFSIKKKNKIKTKIKKIFQKIISIFIILNLITWFLIQIINNFLKLIIIKTNIQNNCTEIYIYTIFYIILLLISINYLYFIKKKIILKKK